jgi:mRNA-degrading endonuclease RelE of RelBE toxin-antitoxin system
MSIIEKLKHFFAKSFKKEEYVPFEIRAADALCLHRSAAQAANTLHDSEIVAVSHTEGALRNRALVMLLWPSQAEDAFDAFWTRGVSFTQYLEEKEEALRRAYDAEGLYLEEILYLEQALRRDYDAKVWLYRYVGAPRSRWSLMLSDDFVRSIAKIDKKLQGRVLEALTKITESPTTVIGDTVKPLTGDLKGLWRYRIGDYRLVYDPSISDRHIILISFEPRGDVY